MVILPNISLKPISSKCSSFWLTPYLLCLVDGVFHQKVGISVGTNCAPLLVDLFLYSYEVYLKDFCQEKQNKLVRSFNFMFRYIDDFLSLNNSYILLFCCSHASHWSWNKRCLRYSYVCFTPWPTLWKWQWRPVKNETLRQKSLFQFSHCEVSIY